MSMKDFFVLLALSGVMVLVIDSGTRAVKKVNEQFAKCEKINGTYLVIEGVCIKREAVLTL